MLCVVVSGILARSVILKKFLQGINGGWVSKPNPKTSQQKEFLWIVCNRAFMEPPTYLISESVVNFLCENSRIFNWEKFYVAETTQKNF